METWRRIRESGLCSYDSINPKALEGELRGKMGALEWFLAGILPSTDLKDTIWSPDCNKAVLE